MVSVTIATSNHELENFQGRKLSWLPFAKISPILTLLHNAIFSTENCIVVSYMSIMSKSTILSKILEKIFQVTTYTVHMYIGYSYACIIVNLLKFCQCFSLYIIKCHQRFPASLSFTTTGKCDTCRLYLVRL